MAKASEQGAVSGASDLLQRIEENYDGLRKSERIVADYLRSHASERLGASITDFGRQIGVSEATVSRVSRALGYKGYPDMKLSMAAGATLQGNFANIPIELDESDSPIFASQKLAEALAYSITETQKFLDAKTLDAALNILSSARNVIFVGVGGAATICDEAAHIFLKMGVNSTSYRDGYTQTIVASRVSEPSAMIGISHTGTTRTVANALIMARRNGVPTIAITGHADSAVGKAADIVLLTRQRPTPQVPLYGDFIEGRACQLFLIDVLYLGLLFRRSQEAKECLKQTTLDLQTFYRQGADIDDS